MTKTINYSMVPTYYAQCQNDQCNKAEICLRYLAHQAMPNTVASYHVVNANYVNGHESECSYYRSNTPEQFAKGFIQLLNRMPHKEMTLFQDKMIKHFSKASYYRMRKGERLISPAEQQYILKLTGNSGHNIESLFDEFVTNYSW